MEYMTFSEKKDKSYKAYSMELAGRTLTVDIGRVAAQANGAALMQAVKESRKILKNIADEMQENINTFCNSDIVIARY